MARGKSKKDKTENGTTSKEKDKKDDKKDDNNKKKKKKMGLGMLGGIMRKKGSHDNNTTTENATTSSDKEDKDKEKALVKEDETMQQQQSSSKNNNNSGSNLHHQHHHHRDVSKSPRSPKHKKDNVRNRHRFDASSPMRGSGGGGGGGGGDDHMENSNSQMEELPPIGEIVATMPSDAVSELPEAMEGGGIEDALDEDEIVYKPEEFDICFDNRHHPGTKEWIQIVRDSLDQFEHTDYSPPVYKAIKKKLKGRRFLIRISRNSKTSWREATKPEVIELFGECFNEEKRRKREGILEDGSDVDSSLQNSAQQSEESLSIGHIMEGTSGTGERDRSKNNGKPPTKKRSASERAGRKTKSNNDNHHHQQQHNNSRNDMSTSRRSGGGGRHADGYLEMAISECLGAQEIAKPFDNVTKLQRGISAEQKLHMLLNLAAAPNMTTLKKELDHLEDLSKRMRYASMAPLLDTLENVERHMTEYFQAVAEKSHSEASFSRHQHHHDAAQSQQQQQQQQHSQHSHHGKHNNENGGYKNDNTKNDYPPESPARRADVGEEEEGGGAHHDGGAVHGNRSIPIVGSPESPKMRKTSKSTSRRTQEEEDDDDDVGEGSVESGEEEENRTGEGEVQSPRQISDSEYDQDEGGSPFDPDAYDASPGGALLDDGEGEGEMEDEPSYVDETGETGTGYEEEMLLDEYGNPIESLGGSTGVEDAGAGLDESGLDEHGSQSLKEEGSDSYDENQGSSGYLGSSGHLGGTPKNNSQRLSSISGMDLANAHILELGQNQDDVSSVGQSQGPMDGYSAHGSQGEEEEFTEVEGLDEDDFEEELEGDEVDSAFSSESESRVEVEEVAPQEDVGPPNPKIEAFFDRLRHFMEVRRKVDEKAAAVDPSDKIRSLKLKVHSGGIEKKNGKFKKEFQQHDLKDKLVRSLDDIYEAAKKAEPALKKVLKEITKEVKGLDSETVYMGPLKTRDRAFQKAREEYSDRKPGPAESWLYDIVRGSVVCKSYKQMSDVNKWLGKNAFVIKAKNRFEIPAFNGYRDLIYHISIPYKGDLAHICEIQVHHKDIKQLDDQFGLPTHMEYFRSSFAGPYRTQEETMDDLVMLTDFGAIGGKLMTKLMRSKNPDQLRLFAGICHEKLDEFDRALELYRRLLILQEDTYGKNHESVARTFQRIGLVQGQMGETEESLMNLQKALAIQESILGKENLEVAESYAEIGHMLTQKGDFEGALKHYRTAMDIREAKLGSDHLMMVTSLQDIAAALTEKGDYKDAVAELKKALGIQIDELGKDHNDVATTHELMGRTLCAQGDFKRAMKELEMALESREEHLGKNHPMTAESHTDIGIVLCQQGDYEIAEWRHRKALRIREAMRGKDHEDCAISYTHLGDALCRKGDYDNALKEINRAMTIRETNLGRDHPLTANSYIDLGNVLCKTGEYEEALSEFRRAMVIHESMLGQLHPDTATSYNAIGRALQLMGKHDQALSEHRRAVSIFETIFGKNHPRTAMGYSCIADTMLAMGDKDEALIQHRRALSIRANVLAKDHPDTQKSCTAIGGLLLEKSDLVGALVAYRQALAITVGLSGEEHPETAVAHMNVGRVLSAQEDYDIALKSFKQAALIREASLGEDDYLTAEAYSMMGSVYNMLGDMDDAEEYHAKAARIRQATMEMAPIDDVSDPSEFSDYDE